ncbi:MAG: HAD-IC family P-type ATPase [Clostridia bacterium]|jgi:Ca2+-transporting ATPase|nr:HAD-IC family P-type ATPase [Clostridia bacterium]
MSGWHSSKLKEVFDRLRTERIGLRQKEAEARLLKYGANEIQVGKKISPFRIFAEQFKSLLVIILIMAAIVSYVIGIFPGQEPRVVDSLLILLIVLANGIFGFLQNYKAEKSIEALRRLVAPRAKVIRDGLVQEIASRNLVKGDIVLIEEGDEVPADVRLIESKNLAVDESSLTGESESVKKEAKILKEDIPLVERRNLLFMTTVVTRGRGRAVVVETGMNTEVGKIAEEIRESKERPTSFQLELNVLGKKITYAVIGIIALILPVQFLIGAADFATIFLTAIALAVASIPEGLPAVVTIALALGTRRMVKRNSLVKKLPVVESLGSVDTICTDKTGTLTEGLMTVRKLSFDGEVIDVSGVGYSLDGDFLINRKKIDARRVSPLLNCALLCNNAVLGKDENQKKKYIGDPTEIALLVAARKAGLEPDEYVRVDEIPFSSERKRMTTVHRKNKELLVFTKGAPEVILQGCSFILEDGKVRRLSKGDKEIIALRNRDLAKDALRVLAFAYKALNQEKKKKENIENDLIFLGLQGMIDAPRRGVKEAIETCKRAGIRVVMITGDNKITAQVVAKEIGIGKNTLEGKDLDGISSQQLRARVKEVDIFARVSPMHKVGILKALQENGHVVAMTGDGVNDAPALKNADIGVSMGIRGTDVAKQTSDMVLLDDNFATIVDAVRNGRTIFDNIRTFVRYLLTTNLAEVLVVFLASLSGYLPIMPVQLLLINFLTDGLPALALGVDPTRKGTMQRKPRKKAEGIMNRKSIYWIMGIGIELALVLLAIFFIGLKNGLATARTMVFTGFVLYEFVKISVIRYQQQLSWFSNKWLVLATTGCIALQLAILYTPLNRLFHVVPLGLFEWLILLLGAGISWILAMLITKYVVRYTH